MRPGNARVANAQLIPLWLGVKRFAKWMFRCLVARALRPLPRRLRYRVALRAAAVLAPLLHILPPIVNTYEWRRAVALRLILVAATEAGIEFEPDLVAPDTAPLEMIRGRGAVACTPHLALAPIFLRFLHDHGFTVAGLSAVEGWCICGTRVPYVALPPSPNVFVQARPHVRAGAVFAAMIDRREDEDAVPIPDVEPKLFLRMTILRFAAALGAPVIFFSTHLRDDGAVEIEYIISESSDPIAAGNRGASFFGAAINKVRKPSRRQSARETALPPRRGD